MIKAGESEQSLRRTLSSAVCLPIVAWGLAATAAFAAEPWTPTQTIRVIIPYAAGGTSDDGHTHLLVANTFAINPSLFSALPYDSLKDLTPITYAGVTPHVVVVNPSLPVKTLAELIEYARKHPGKLNYGSSATALRFISVPRS